MTEPFSEEMKALDEAIAAVAVDGVGGVGNLASRLGVAASAPSMWRARARVPAEHCPAIERETGVRCERLRPDIPWDVLRLQSGVHAGDGTDRAVTAQP